MGKAGWSIATGANPAAQLATGHLLINNDRIMNDELLADYR